MNNIHRILFFLFIPLAVYSQNSELDSLLKKLSFSMEDSNKVWLLIKIGDNLSSNEPAKARIYLQQAAMLSRKLSFNTGIFRSNASYGETFVTEGKPDSMIVYIRRNLQFARELNDSLQIGIALMNIGISYRDMMDFEKALSYFLEGKAIFEKKSDPTLFSQVNDALQILYNYRTEYDKAIGYGEQAIVEARKQKDPILILKPLVNLSLSYIAKSDLTKGNQLLMEALAICKALNNPRIEAIIKQNLADIALKNYDIPLTKKYINYSLKVFQEVGSWDGQASCLRALAVCFLQERNYSVARELADSALAIDRKYSFRKEEADILRVLSCIYYATKDERKGFNRESESSLVLEKMIKEVISQESANLEKKYETEKKENEIIKLNSEKKVQELNLRQKSTLNFILIAGAIVLMALLFLVYRNYHQKQNIQQQRINELETEKQLTATEAVLKGEEQERTRLAKDLHDGLGGMLSGIKYSLNTMKGNLIMTPDNTQAFERSMDMLDSSIKEMRRVAHNMMPEALVKFGLDTALKDFCNDINQTGVLKVTYQSIGLETASIDQTTSITIYRIVQELINNSIKHAAAKTAIVQLSKANDKLSVTVEDDGKGFDTAILKQAKGIGWSNIQNRVEFLKGKLDVQSGEGKGTSVLLEFDTN